MFDLGGGKGFLPTPKNCFLNIDKEKWEKVTFGKHMVLILGGISDYVAHKWKLAFSEKNPICACSRSNQLPETDWITEIAPYVRTHFWVTI